MGNLSKTMEVSPATATSMVKVLAKAGLVKYQPRNGCRLTQKGEQLALHVLRRHRLVELFLVKVLALDWSEIHEEAEQLEHAISDKVLAKIDKALGYPGFDPHGDPIPSANGEITDRDLYSLADSVSGQKVRIARIMDQDTEFLKLAHQFNLIPGNNATIEDNNSLADSITIASGDTRPVTLGMHAASKIMVELVSSES